MPEEQPNNPLHGVTLETIMTRLVEHYGWEYLASRIDVRAFKYDPSLKSALTFLRRTPWARTKIERIYMRARFPR